jgi:isopentenyl diphosphate isomerase/L-lactate dehydrogenase-like FMN-dependent dehydrogenase
MSLVTPHSSSATDVLPEVFCAQDYETLAARTLPEAIYAYVAGGSDRGITAQGNRDAFAAYDLQPRILRDVTSGHTRVKLRDVELPHPILLAPVALQLLLHAGAEIETARAAAATDTCLVVSTQSSATLEAIAEAAGSLRWFQLYFQPQRATTLDLVKRAHVAGYQAIVVTLDVPVQPASQRSLHAGFRMPVDVVAANLTSYPPAPPPTAAREQSRILQGLMRTAPTWDDLQWLLRASPLPVWVKGVMHPHDARRLIELGVAGIVVSNHGGRGLDGAPPSLTALTSIRAAVAERVPLLFDGGIRSGADIFKALALGADAVLIGRLQACALATAGALGVAHVIKLLREELEVCMALTGCATIPDIMSAGPDAAITASTAAHSAGLRRQPDTLRQTP